MIIPMASQNIEEWSSDQVADWLTGLGAPVDRYVEGLRARGLHGRKLLTLRCDDLEYLGVVVIGHQELILEAVEHLRNYQYEMSRECVARLALRARVAAAALRSLCPTARRLHTQALADVANTVSAVKPLVCWLDRWSLFGGSGLAERRALLLKLSLEGATSAQRDRFAEQPARAVAAAAAAIAATADYIIQDVQDHMVLVPARVDTVTLQQGTRPLGFQLAPSPAGARHLTDIRFGSPAHRHPHIHDGDEILQVGDRVVVGWGGEAVTQECIRVAASAPRGELTLVLRRRGARGAGAALATPTGRQARDWPRHMRRFPPPWEYNDLRSFKREFGLLPPTAEPAPDAPPAPRADPPSSSDESEPLSPPASPSHAPGTPRLYAARPRAPARRRYTVSGGSPRARRHQPLHQFWQELKNSKWAGSHSGSACMEAEGGAGEAGGRRGGGVGAAGSPSPYRRGKAQSCSTGLELPSRPATCLGVSLNHPKLAKIKLHIDHQEKRGKLDKSHSTPAYDFDSTSHEEPGSLVTQIIPESPTTPNDSPTILVHSAEKADQILDFKKSSTQIEEAIQQQQSKRQNGDEKSKFPFNEKDEEANKVLETINIAMIEHQNKERSSRLSTCKQSPEHAQTKPFSVSEHVRTIQNEIVQAINEQRVVTSVRGAQPASQPGVAPEPPPRPVCTQKPIIKEPQLPMKEMKVPFPVLKPVRQPEVVEQHTPLKPFRHGEPIQISVPLKHITKHDIQMIPNERRELPPLNCEINLNASQSDVSKAGKDSPSLSQSQSLQRLESPVSLYSPVKTSTLSPTTASVVRGMFPSSKSKSLKKKNSILAKGRHVPFRVWSVYATLAGRAWQRVRGGAGGARGGGGGARWAPRALLLADDRLLAYRGPQCSRADCVIYLNGFTVSEAPEVKSRPYAFKVYHTGKVFYFAAGGGAARAAWTQALARATLHHAPPAEDSKQFSETDYSDEESDTESPEKRLEQKDREREKEREKDRERDKDRDKSKFGSLKKLTHRMQRSESQEHVAHSSTSLDRKYLRFFSRNKDKNKDDSKSNKKAPVVAPVVVPTEHYRSYRRAPSSDLSPASPASPAGDKHASTRGNKIPKPINYIHASNPNLLDFEKSDFAAKPNLQVPLPKSKVHKPDNFIGLVTLEEFMLKKQEEERQQVYSNRVLMGIERDKKSDESNKRAAKDLQKQLEKIIPDVIYGELPTFSDDKPSGAELVQGRSPAASELVQGRSLPRTPERVDHADNTHNKPVSVRGKDGYEKIVYTSGKSRRDSEPTEPPKIKPRKLSRPSPDIARKSSLTSAKDLGYEVIYGDEGKAEGKSVSRNMSTTSSKDLGYETVFGEADTSAKGSSNSVFERRASDDRPAPPRIMPKSMQVLNRQSSLTSTSSRGGGGGGGGGGGVDCSPVFLQGDSPEKFWLNSLRRNDKVVAFPTSSSSSPGAGGGGGKPLKSARNYSPVTLPPTAAALAASPASDQPDRSPSPPTGMSRLRAMFSRPRAPRAPQEVPPAVEEGGEWGVRLQRPPEPHYPHLQCPPTFEPETYSLQPRLLHRDDQL